MKKLSRIFSTKMVAGILTLMLVLGVAGLIETSSSVVFATEDTTTVSTPYTDGDGYISEYHQDLSRYIGEEAPSAETEGYEDWLFAGWYGDKECTEEAVIKSGTGAGWAKFVPADVLSVKLQLKANTTADAPTNMRLVSSVDSLNYKEVGFYVFYNGSENPVRIKTSTVYENIVASYESGVEYNYSPKIVDVESEYFVTATLINIASTNFNNTFYIRPYWTTLDGTMVYGVNRFVTVANGISDTNVNLTVKVDSEFTEGATVELTDAATASAETSTKRIATVAKYEAPYVYLNMDVTDRDNTLLSLTRFTMADGDSTVSVDWRNLKTTHVVSGSTSINSDTSWYDVDSSAEKFVIATSADFHGVAEIVNGGTDVFKNDTIYVVADIVVNKGTAYINDDGTAGFTLDNSSDTLYEWKAISPDASGKTGSGYRFNGTFDGQGHTISGVYFCDKTAGAADGAYHGLFGITNTSSLITNFSLKNSVFIVKDGCGSNDGTQADLGSIVGQPMGDVSGIYSNAIVVSENGIETGGLFGRLNPAGVNNTSNITNCWFDGEVYVTYNAYDETTGTYGNAKEMYVGGIVGKAFNIGTINITACHNSGKITCIQKALATYNATSGAEDTKLAVAGLVGGLTDTPKGTTAHTLYLNMTQSMSTGKIVAKRVVPTTTDGEATYTLTQVTSGLGVAHLIYNKITATSTDEEGNTVRDRMVVTDCLYSTDDFSTGYQRSSSTGNYLPSNCEGDQASAYSGMDAYTTAARLGIYTNDEGNDVDYWVVREDGLVILKTFCDEWTDIGWYERNKTDNVDTFVIETAEELYGFSYISQSNAFDGDTVELGDDIKMNLGTASVWAKATDASVTESLRTFTPICKVDGNDKPSEDKVYAFRGTFDGKGYEVSGVYVYETSNASNGFFGQIKSGEIKNFKLTNSCIVNATTTHNTGAIVGNMRGGTVSGVYTDAIVKTVSKSSQMATGGIVGIMSGGTKVSECWFKGEVHTVGYYAGGIVGRVLSGSPTIENCISNGEVVSTYEATNNGTKSAFVGGVLGAAHLAKTNTNKVTIKNCLNMSNVTAAVDDGSIGAVVGRVYDVATTFENVYTTANIGGAITGVGNTTANTYAISGTPALISEADLTGLNSYIYTDFDFTNTWGAVEGGTPVIQALYDGTVISDFNAQRISTNWYYNKLSYVADSLEEATTTFTILDEADLFGLARIVNDEVTLFSGETIKLVANRDFDLSPNWEVTVEGETVTTTGTPNAWTPIGGTASTKRFAGTFDGNDNKISGVYISDYGTNGAGLFGYGAATSNIKNFTLENSYFNYTQTQSAAIIGITQGSLSKIYVTDSVAVQSSSTHVGGFIGDYVGTTTKTMSNCWFDGTIISTSTSSTVYGGGFVGRVYEGKKTLSDCLFTGNFYNTAGGVFVGGMVGGMMGQNNTAKTEPKLYLTDCVATGTVTVDDSKKDAVGAVLGRALAASKNRDTDTNWPEVYITNLYTTGDLYKESGTKITPTDRTVRGFGTMSSMKGKLYGSGQYFEASDLAGVNGYINTELDFRTTDDTSAKWVVTEEGPRLASFAEASQTDFTGVDQISLGWYYNNFENIAGTAGYTPEQNQLNLEFEISDVADMRGFASLVNTTDEDKQEFFGVVYGTDGETVLRNKKTVKLANDIIFNNVTTGEEAAGWADGSIMSPATSWVPIGTVDGDVTKNAFQGTFDGDGYAIKGLYVSDEEQYLGLFRKIQDATICNLNIENSYFCNTATSGNSIIGSVAGGGSGTFDSIYSNAIVQGRRVVGGLIARVSNLSNDDTEMILKNCQFNGTVDIDYVGTEQLYCGGLVGFAAHGSTLIDTCLYTGNISLEVDLTESGRGGWGARIGGLCGGDNGTTAGYVQAINCLSAGTLNSKVLSTSLSPMVNVLQMNHVIGNSRHANSWAKNTYVIMNNTKTIEATGVTTESTEVFSRGSDSLASNYDVNSAFEKDELVGYGASMWTTLAFTDSYRLALDNAALEEGEEEITEVGPIWAAVEGQLPVPATLAENPLDASKPDMELDGQGTEESPFLITSVDELVGFAKLSKINTFKGQYVALGNDIVINEGELASDWADGKAAPTFPWHATIGIGADGKRFEGTFDGTNPETGEVHTISGICLESGATYLGLFAATEEGSAIKNLRLKNSYIEQEGDGYTGSIVGDCRGTISNVYSDAIIRSETEQNGGIIGRANGWSYVKDADEDDTTDGRTSVAMDNCWYAGKIILTGEGRYAGGIIGTVIQGEWTLNNCVFTGKITCEYTGDSYAYVGGMCGALNTPSTVASSSMETKLTLNSCISAGTIKTANKDYGAGAILGRAKAEVWFDSITTSTTDETTGETVKTTTTTFKDSKTSHVVMNNVFATREAGYQEVGYAGAKTEYDSAGTAHTSATPTVTGKAVWTNNADRLIGYCTEETKTDYYDGGSLDFTSTFVIREEGVPVPATFTDLDNVTQVATSDLNTILALATMDTTWSLENAVNYGLGHYVLTSTGKTYDNYTAYLEALEAQGFTPYTTLEETGTDGVYNVIYTRVKGEWVLNVLFVQNTKKVTLTISSGLSSLSPDLEPEANTTSGDVTLSMLQLEGSKANLDEAEGYTDYFYGNSFVFKLPNGRFIINDGGNSGDMAGLMAYLRKEAGLAAGDTTTKIYIDAWTVTHQHGDHLGVMKNIVSNPSYAEQLVVSAIYLNEPSQNAMLCYPENANVMSAVKEQYRGIRLLKDEDGNTPKVYWCQTGQRYYFDGLTLDVIQSQEQIPVSDYGYYNIGAVVSGKKDFNTVSTNMLFTTTNEKKVLITGDSNDVNMEYIMNAYGDASEVLANINVYQAPHHGKNTSYNIQYADNTFTDYLAGLATKGITSGQFDVSLFPCSVFYEYDGKHESYVFPGAEGANKHLIDEKSTAAYHYGKGTIKVTLGDTITAGLDTSVDTGTEDSETSSGEE